MQRKKVARVIEINSARMSPEDPTPHPPSPSAQRPKFHSNQHTRRHFLLLMFGPLAYRDREDGFEKAIEESNHNRKQGISQILDHAQRDWEREQRAIENARRAAA